MRTQQVECIVFRKKDDESLLDACYREIKEEVGIDKGSMINIIEDVYQFCNK